MIFVQPIYDKFSFLSFYWLKNREGKQKRGSNNIT